MMRSLFARPVPVRLAIAAGLLMCLSCSDEYTGPIDHYFNPIWARGDAFVAAGYEHFATPSETVSDANFVVRDVATRIEHPLHLDGMTERDRFWIDPTARYIVRGGADGFTFFSVSGDRLGSFVPQPGLTARTVSFVDSGGAYLWLAVGSGRVAVGRAEYASEPWNPTLSEVLKDTLLPNGAYDAVVTAPTLFAVYFGNGDVCEFDQDGRMLSRVHITPKGAEDPWKTRLHFATVRGARTLYAIDDSGLAVIDLATASKSITIAGVIVNISVNPATAFVTFETRTYDTWIQLGTGVVQRVSPQGRMASLSTNGKSLAAVLPYRGGDSLTVFRFVL